MRWKRIGLAGLVAPALAGCHVCGPAAHDCLTEKLTVSGEAALTHELRQDAKVAWREVRTQFPRRMFSPEFRDGFLDGYTDYLDRGGGATLPAVPPAYLTRNKKYYSPEGQARLKDYFLGFQYGMDVAVATGCRQFLTVPVVLAAAGPEADHPEPAERAAARARRSEADARPGDGRPDAQAAGPARRAGPGRVEVRPDRPAAAEPGRRPAAAGPAAADPAAARPGLRLGRPRVAGRHEVPHPADDRHQAPGAAAGGADPPGPRADAAGEGRPAGPRGEPRPAAAAAGQPRPAEVTKRSPPARG